MSATDKLPKVIGIYGVPASGRTSLLRQLEKELGQEDFAYYEGSEAIADLASGGVMQFRHMSDQDNLACRKRAITDIRDECLHNGRVAVVCGHCSFWAEREQVPQFVFTPQDMMIYTHILYLDISADVIAQNRTGGLSDGTRRREVASIDPLRKWRTTEKETLRSLCEGQGTLFGVLSTPGKLVDKVATLIRDFKYHNEDYNLRRAEREVDEVLARRGYLQTMLVIDGDRTLSSADTEELFWAGKGRQEDASHLKGLFESPLGYSYAAFRQAVLLYEKTADKNEGDFRERCDKVARSLKIHPEFRSLLQRVAEHVYVGAVVVTCGLRDIWEQVLEKEGVSQVPVIGGGRIQHRFVVTDVVKANIVSRLRTPYRLHVVAFGDSPLDLPILKAADQAVVIVSPISTRSKSIDEALLQAINNDGLQAHQVLLPSNVAPKLPLNILKLPLTQLDNSSFLNSIFRYRSKRTSRVIHTTDRSISKLLITPIRNATIQGPTLREAHRRVGWFLASDMLANLIGLKEYNIPHVQGHQTKRYRLQYEDHTSIVALMRGGEPIGFGVSNALPRAMFIHAKEPNDIISMPLEINSDGISTSFTTNHLGPFVLTRAVMPLLENAGKGTGDARVVMVSAASFKLLPPGIRFDSLQSFNAEMEPTALGGADFTRYSLSKLANILFAKHLQKNFDDTNSRATAMALHPGLIKTDGVINSLQPGKARTLDGRLTPAQGAITALFAATNPAVVAQREDYKGAYLVPPGAIEELTGDANDDDLARELWATSEHVVEAILGK
ncbi:uracil phosphoribosyltransferase-domain-containing protein [Xylariaceae sp. FL1272]|nr:uracil phosphoribosyltransferase-domain-containing protein [Xylariaceae sp. FL1272]